MNRNVITKTLVLFCRTRSLFYPFGSFYLRDSCLKNKLIIYPILCISNIFSSNLFQLVVDNNSKNQNKYPH